VEIIGILERTNITKEALEVSNVKKIVYR